MGTEVPHILVNLDLDRLRTEPRAKQAGKILIETTQPETGREYGLLFVREHGGNPYIRVSTKTKIRFIREEEEAEAQEGLVALTLATKDVTGGAIDIHFIYGAVHGTTLTPVGAEFLPLAEDKPNAPL